MAQRTRRRASDLAPRRRNPFFALILLTAALVLVLAYKASTSEDMAKFVDSLATDPDLELPPSVLERDGAVPAFDAAQ